MDPMILERLSVITPEERRILDGQMQIDRTLYMDGSRDIITGSKLLEKGKQITIRPHTRFIRFPRHTHDYVEIVYMCRGQTTHLAGGRQYVLHAGELLMLGQHATHEILPAGVEDIAVNFIVRPDFLGGILNFLGKEETPLRRFVLDCLMGGTREDPLYFRVADVLPVQNLVENLLWTLISDPPNKQGIHQMTMGLLFAELLGHTETLSLPSPEQETTVRVLRYIEENYRCGSLTEIAGRLHAELTALSRLIKRETGKTYTELTQEKRLAQAAWLLKNTGKTVDEIASLVGYENTSYFHRLFAQRFSVSPRQYRISK